MTKTWDCVIVGGGLAGLSAGLTLAQRRHQVEIIANSFTDTRAGKLAQTTYYPGGSAQANGRSLADHIQEQVRAANCSLTTATVQTIQSQTQGFELTLSTGESRQARSVIVATGIQHAGHPAVPGEDALLGKGVFYQMAVDGPLYSGKTIAVLGKSAEIVQEVIHAATWFEKIYLIVPATKLDISEAVQETLQKNRNIELLYSASLKAVKGTAHVEAVTILAAGQERDLAVQAVWIPTHTHQGNVACVEGVLNLSDKRTPLVGAQLQTSVPGIFACGDVLCAQYQHPSIAAAQGIMAAYSCAEYLKTL